MDEIWVNEPIAAERELSVYLVTAAGAAAAGQAGSVTIRVAKPGGNLVVDAGVTITEVTGGAGGGYRVRLSADAVSVVGQGHVQITGAGIQTYYGTYTVAQHPWMYYGPLTSGAATTMVLGALGSTVDSFYASSVTQPVVFIVSGTGAGQSRACTSYVGSTKVLTVNEAWAVTPDATSIVVISFF